MIDYPTVDLLIESIDEEMSGPLTSEGVNLVHEGWKHGRQALQSELAAARDEAERLRAQLSDMTGCACDAESLCKYHAMTTASGRSVVLRKQAEAVGEVNRKLTTMSEDADSRPLGSDLVLQYAASVAGEEAQRLRQQADDLDNV